MTWRGIIRAMQSKYNEPKHFAKETFFRERARSGGKSGKKVLCALSVGTKEFTRNLYAESREQEQVSNRTLVSSKRNLRVKPPTLKSKAYRTLLQPQLEYCCSIWGPRKRIENSGSHHLEKIQRRAARWALGNYEQTASVTEMLKVLNWRTLEQRRADVHLALMCKTANNLVAVKQVCHYKPTDSHSYLLYSSSHPSHIKDSIPYSQFLRLSRLCSEDSDCNSKCDEMSNFFSERGYPDNILSKALNRVQNVNRESVLKPSASNNEEQIPFTLTFHPNNLAARNVVLRDFKILQLGPETAPIFPNPPLGSFKRDRNLRNSLVRSSLPSNLGPGTFNCSREVCNTCPFINSKTYIQGPNGSYQVNDHFDYTTSNVIYCITCTLCNKLYIGESGVN